MQAGVFEQKVGGLDAYGKAPTNSQSKRSQDTRFPEALLTVVSADRQRLQGVDSGHI